EEIRTIFVTGFPSNVHERELHNLVCFLPGYEASQMNTKPATGTAPQGFALFSSHAHAQAAMLTLHDMPFDTDCHLRCEIAHKNMYLKVRHEFRFFVFSLEYRFLRFFIRPSSLRSSPVLTSPEPSFLKPQVTRPPVPSCVPAGMAPPAFTSPLLGGAPAVSFGPVTNKFDNPPCNTLFIGNLGDTVDENELMQVFGNQPGYKQLKLLRHPRQVSCFVEFVDMASASAVHSRLQGCILHTSDRGPIRIQYSKNPYGKR
ncbi:hypothetical protein VOLCADRAFT_32205, partial [Volvox carteri f. nagariensis]